MVINDWIGLSLSLSLSFNGHFPGEPGLAGVYWSKRWWRWWWQLDYWSYKSCKAPVISSPPTNQHPVFLQAICPYCCPTNSQSTEGKNITFHGLAYPKLTLGSANFVWPLIAPGYHGEGCHASHQLSDASTPIYIYTIKEPNLSVTRSHPSQRAQALRCIFNAYVFQIMVTQGWS